MKMKHTAAAAVILTAVAGAGAERIALTGPYIGADVGYANGKVDKDAAAEEVCQNDPTCVVTSSTEDPDTYGLKVYGGYLFNQYFALEGGYFNLGEVSFENRTNTGETYKGTASMQGANVDAVGHLPLLDQLSLFGRIGVIYAELKKDYSYSGGTLIVNGVPKDMNPTNWDVGYKYGVGLQYDFTPRLGVRGEWESYHVSEEDSSSGFDMNLFAVGVVYRFGSAPETQAVAEAEPFVVVEETPAPVEPAVIEKEIVREPVIIMKPTQRVVLATDTLFDFDKSDIKQNGRIALKNLAENLHGGDRLIVTGYTDSLGSEAYNLKLSQRRADAVKKQLSTFGIAPDHIETRAMGESDPVASNATEEGRAANRRVVIDIIAAPDETDEKVIYPQN